MKQYQYPETKKTDYFDVYHGEKVPDPYVWLERAKEPEVLKWVEEQHACTDRFFKQFGNALEKDMEKQRGERCKPSYGRGGVSIVDGYIAGLKVDDTGKESFVLLSEKFEEMEMILSVEEINPAVHFYEIKLNPGNPEIGAFEILYPGEDRPSILVYNWKTKETIARCDNSFSYTWNKDGNILYYADVYIDKEKQVAYNRITSYDMNTKETKVLYQYPDNSVLIMLDISDTGETLFGEVWVDYHDKELVKVDVRTGESVVYQHEGPADCHYIGTSGEDHYILTDENAPYGKIIAVSDTADTMAGAREILPESRQILKGAVVVGDKLVVISFKDVNAVLEIYDAEGKFLKSPKAPCEYGNYNVLILGKLGNVWKEKNRMFLEYQSFAVPQSILSLDIEEGTLEILYQEIDDLADDIVVEQKFVTTEDGNKAPAYLVYQKGKEFEGNVRTLMYGYGGYNVSELPSYKCVYLGNITDWVREGNMYVLCTIRGGGEYGAKWHEDGCLLNKTKGYDDFIAITEMLIKEGYTNPSKIAIIGGSNGGLLVTALLTRRPDLFQAVIASVPHTDMLHFRNDDRGTMYMTEYGDWADEETYRYLKSYSPYHNVKEGVHYPAVYIQTGECDNNVPPYHGKKMAARLQECQGCELPVLLRVLPFGSHDTGVGEDHYKTIAERKLFLDWALGKDGK